MRTFVYLSAIISAVLCSTALPAAAAPATPAIATAAAADVAVEKVHLRSWRHRHWRDGRAWWHGGRYGHRHYRYYTYPRHYGYYSGPGISLHFGDRKWRRHRDNWND